MKLLLLAHSLNEGGAERQLVTFARSLAACGRPPVVAVFYSGGRLESELSDAGIPLHHLEKRGRWDLVSFLNRTAAMVQSESAATIYSMLPTPNLVAAALKLTRRELRVVWGVRASQLDLADYPRYHRWTQRGQRVLARSADHIIVNSYAGRRTLMDAGYSPRGISVIPNGIDVNAFQRTSAGRERVRNAWGVRPHEKLIGLVARFDPMKDHGSFLQAAAALGAREPDARFVCVGDGPHHLIAAARQQAAELGIAARMIWAGARRDMAAVYSALDLCVLSSAYGEGFPNVLAEAMACGTPCVSTDVGDAWIILGEFGPVVPPRDPARLAAALQSVLDSRIDHAWRCAAAQHIALTFSVERMRDATERVLWA